MHTVAIMEIYKLLLKIAWPESEQLPQSSEFCPERAWNVAERTKKDSIDLSSQVNGQDHNWYVDQVFVRHFHRIETMILLEGEKL